MKNAKTLWLNIFHFWDYEDQGQFYGDLWPTKGKAEAVRNEELKKIQSEVRISGSDYERGYVEDIDYFKTIELSFGEL